MFCLKTPYLIYTVDSLALNSLPTHASMHVWATHMGHTWGQLTAFLCSGTLGSTLAPPLGTVSSTEITNKRHRNAKNLEPDRPQKGHVLTVWTSGHLVWPQLEYARWRTQNFCHSACLQMSEKLLQVLVLGVIPGVNLQLWTLQIMRMDSVCWMNEHINELTLTEYELPGFSKFYLQK